MIPLRQLVNTDHVVQNWILSTCFVCQATTKINITLFFLWKILYALFSVTIYLSPKVILVLSCDVEPTFNGHMWLKRGIFNKNLCRKKRFRKAAQILAPVKGELVEPHGAHEGDVRQLVVEQLPLLLRRVGNPQPS